MELTTNRFLNGAFSLGYCTFLLWYCVKPRPCCCVMGFWASQYLAFYYPGTKFFLWLKSPRLHLHFLSCWFSPIMICLTCLTVVDIFHGRTLLVSVLQRKRAAVEGTVVPQTVQKEEPRDEEVEKRKAFCIVSHYDRSIWTPCLYREPAVSSHMCNIIRPTAGLWRKGQVLFLSLQPLFFQVFILSGMT